MGRIGPRSMSGGGLPRRSGGTLRTGKGLMRFWIGLMPKDRRMSKGSTHYAPIFNGLWDIKHVKKMGMAVYLFGELLDRVNSKGKVEVSHHEISEKTGIPIRTLERWMSILRAGNYISVQGKNPMLIKISNYRRIRGGQISTQNDPENIPPDVAGSDTTKPPDVAAQNAPLKPPDVAETLQNVAGLKSSSPNKTVSSKPLFKIKNNIRRKSKISDTKRADTKKSKKASQKFIPADLETAQFILQKIRKLKPDFKIPNLNSWANDIRLMRERDNRTHEEIRALFTWANNHHFWCSNILSPSALRRQWDRLSIQRDAKGNGRNEADSPVSPEQERARKKRIERARRDNVHTRFEKEVGIS